MDIDDIDLTSTKLTIAQNGTTAKKAQNNNDGNFIHPDGGSRAWCVMIGSFLCNGILFGVINSYSVFYNEIYENLIAQNVTEAGSKAGKFNQKKNY